MPSTQAAERVTTMEPYLSVVVAARNDNHGGDLLKRMQTFLTALLEQCRRHKTPAELIIVEWNPPEDRPRLIEALCWDALSEMCAVRVIEVPEKLHRRFRHAEGLPLYQMIAKNVGIRRARGRFVLATNIDIIFSDELMQFIARQELAENLMYRIDRLDVMKDVPAEASLDEQLAYCRLHVMRVNAAEGTSSRMPDGAFAFEVNDIAPRDSGLIFGKGWFARELDGAQAFRWIENDAEIVISRLSDGERLLVLDLEPGPGVAMGVCRVDVFDEAAVRIFSEKMTRRIVANVPIPKSRHESTRLRLHIDGGGHRGATDPRTLNAKVFRCSLEKTPAAPRKNGLLSRIPRQRPLGPPKTEVSAAFLHMTTCGDFTLLARERWFDLRGYPEFDMYSMNIDALFCWAAHHGGAPEHILKEPMRIYHIEHETGSGWTPEGHTRLVERMAERGVPWLDYSDVIRWACDMNRFDAPIIFNREDWGLAAEDLSEMRPYGNL